MASSIDVVTFDEAREAINMVGSGANHAEKLETLVTATSELLDQLCGPVVQRAVTQTSQGVPSGSVWLNEWVPGEWSGQAITSVTEYVSGTGIGLTAESLTVAGGYLLVDGALSRRSGFYGTAWSGRVQVVYTAGRYANTASVGARFKQAALNIIAREWPQYASAWARGGDVFGAPEGGVGFFRSVDPVVEQWLRHDLRMPAIA